MQLQKAIRSRFAPILKQWLPDESALQSSLERIVASRDASLADYQANVAMPLQKVVGLPPLEIANKILGELKIDDLCTEVSVAGAGYVNLRLSNSFLQEACEAAYRSDRLGVEGVSEPKTTIIDYSSPNVAKPMHVGHIRSTVIGAAIANILRFLGDKVITDNHLGDWGTQFGMIIYGYKNFRDEAAFQKAPVTELGRLYRVVQRIIGHQNLVKDIPNLEKTVEVATERVKAIEAKLAGAPNDKKIAKELKSALNSQRTAADTLAAAQQSIASAGNDHAFVAQCHEHADLGAKVLKETSKLHYGDEENLKLWELFIPSCMEEIHGIYKRLDVGFDYEYGESYYHEMLPAVIEELLAKDLATQSEGAICVFLDEYEAPMIVRKQDGAFLYSTTDIATAIFREREFSPDVCLYVTDHRQSEHFQKLFLVLKKLGLSHTTFKHVSFGTVMGKDGKPFKTRSGDNIGLESMLDEAIARAWEVVCNPSRIQAFGMELTEEEKKEIADKVGIGAIKYADLSHNRTSDYVFDMDKMVQLEGNTAAYIQYSYARTRSILRRAADSEYDASNLLDAEIKITHPAERALAIQVLRFEDTLLQSTVDYLPSVLTEYLFDLAKLFSSFFDQCPVLKAESQELFRSRLKLADLSGKVLKQGLELLGIETVERM